MRFLLQSYVKLQDAYVAETGAYIGNWDKIGYSVPGNKTAGTAGQTGTIGETTNFIYTEAAGSGTWVDGTNSLPSAAADLWTAKNKLKLNECEGNVANWGLGLQKGTNGGEYTWKTRMGANCDALTPNFSNLGSGSYGG